MLSKVDLDAKKRAQKILESNFPQIASIRLSAAHPREIGSTPRDHEKHSIKGGHSDRVISSSSPQLLIEGSLLIEDHRLVYTSSISGRAVSFELSETSYKHLVDAQLEFWNAFSPLEDQFWRDTRLSEKWSF
ncbi:hypothetical protein [Sphingomonas lenta]|uniref:hypothetical protein n=1 Tax=Sphingomonas lenta TaxID=1141887 RepID=UPI001595A960|nr:hypothetical protein [Sphingomonas lenta]